MSVISVTKSQTKPVLKSSYNDVTQTSNTSMTHDVIITRHSMVTQNVYNMHNVTSTVTEYLTSTVTEYVTSYVTVVQTSTIQWAPISTNFSQENDTDPVQELREMGEQAMERKKTLTKKSVYEKRASAKYMGYVAVIFIVCSVGSLVVFDMLSICQKAKCCEVKNGQKIAYRKKGKTQGEKQETCSSL